jgi:Domain of unknown function (DUF4177)
MKWEYSIVPFETRLLFPANFNEQKVTDEVNRMGDEGWELVNCFDTNTGGSTRYIVAVFKRPKQ